MNGKFLEIEKVLCGDYENFFDLTLKYKLEWMRDYKSIILYIYRVNTFYLLIVEELPSKYSQIFLYAN
jgi:hypothetical protein